MSYRPTIGLEIHAELKTATKLFCDSKNDPDETRPNINICPICMGYPGTLPVMNREALWHVMRIGHALGGTLADVTYFDRKNYFYPDIPKGYQISQYKHPIVSGGSLADVAITRVHLEEDTARSQHIENGSLIDFNRAGLPLMELVTEPVIHDADTAGRFARELQLLLRYLGAGDANMEKGEMRVEANISVSKDETKGTKVEVKNLNSFRAVERAIAYEIKRQSEVLESGGQVIQETRGWDEAKQETFAQRLKEGSEDYRYFPEPDLPMFSLNKLFTEEDISSSILELPWEKREKYRLLGLNDDQIELFTSNLFFGKFFDQAVDILKRDGGENNEFKKRVKTLASYSSSDLVGLIEGEELGGVYPVNIVELIVMVESGQISSRGAKDILKILHKEGGSPRAIAEERSLFQKSDEKELQEVVATVIAEHKEVADEYRGGKEAALQFLVGQGMKATRGSANPAVLKELLIKELR